MSSINFPKNPLNARSDINKSCILRNALSENKAPKTFRNVMERPTISGYQPPQLYRDSLSYRSTALDAIDQLAIDEAIKKELKITLKKLPEPNVKMDFPGNEGQPTLIVWRGMSVQSLADIVGKGSIGLEADVNTTPPTQEEVRTQVGDERKSTLPEFTFLPEVAKGFARYKFSRGGVGVIACVAIAGKYIVPGSGSEGGVVCRPGAPMKLLAWEPGETIGCF